MRETQLLHMPQKSILFCIALQSICASGAFSAEVITPSSALETLEHLVSVTDGHQTANLIQSIPSPSLEDKGVTNELSVLFLKELGNPPTKEEERKIRKMLKTLNKTKVGMEICKSFGVDGCTWDNLAAAKIELTTRDLGYHLPEPLESILSLALGSSDPIAATPKPSLINGRTILCLDKTLIAKEDIGYIAPLFFHELSHVSDNRNLGESDNSVTKAATEYKAVALHMMLYDELLRTQKIKSDHSVGIEFILSVYRWKNGGPKPNMDFSVVIAGKRYTAAEVIGLNLKEGDSGLQSIWKLTKFFYNIPNGTIQETDLKYLHGVRASVKEIEPKYLGWFPSNQPTVPLPNTQPQQLPHNNNNNNGNSNSGGGNNNQPNTPNPQFPSGTWPTAGQ